MFTSGVRLFTIGCAILLFAQHTFAAITLELRPSSQTVIAGSSASVGLYVVSDLPAGEPVGRVDAVLLFDPNKMTLLGHDLTGAPAWGSAGFSSFSPLNPDWTDGDAFFKATIGLTPGPCGTPEVATPAGLLVTTFQFDVGSILGSTTVALPASLGTDTTAVYDAQTALSCPGVPYPITRGPAAVLNVVACSIASDCNDGTACTDDLCTAGVCSNPDNYDPATQCCDPVLGGTIVLSDGNDCTRDICDLVTGQVTHPNENFGVACGDPSSSSCTTPDTCDGNGVCLTNNQTDGIPCAEVNQCIDAGTCLGGVCSNPTAFSPDGTVCDDGLYCTEALVNAVIEPGVCTGGVCGGTSPCSGVLPICFENPGGFICGNCTNRFECPGDFGCITWDCLSVFHICASTQNDVLCDDNLFCTAVDNCEQDGTCTNSGSPCLTGGICDEGNNVCVDCNVSSDCKACDVSGTICLDTADCPSGETCVPQFDLCNPIACNSGVCEFDTPVTCPQIQECLINVCNPTSGLCEFKIPEQVVCTPGSCPLGFQCNTQSGVCFRSDPCSDGNGCTQFDQCVNGTCLGGNRQLNENVEMRLIANPPQSGGSFYAVGETIDIRLELSIDALVSTSSRNISTVEAALLWDPSVIGGAVAPTINDPCTGTIDPLNDCPVGQYDWDMSAFGVISDGADLNLNLIDGDALYFAGVGLGDPMPTVSVTQDLWVTTFKFIAVAGTGGAGTNISLTACVGSTNGNEGSNSRVTSGVFDRTGQLFSETIVIGCQIAADCDDNNACTTDVCEIDQSCSNTPTYNVATECCNPSDGSVTQIFDANVCTDDVCDALTGVVTHPFSPSGQSCGNPAASECDAQDTCDGAVTCVDRQQPTGTTCGDTSNTACTNPDSCDGNGACLANDAATGTACPDGLLCNGDETCLGGVCQNGTPVDCSSDGIACTINDFCDENWLPLLCTGIPNDALCAPNEICDAELGCIIAVTCDPPIVSTVGSRYFSIEPLPIDGTVPTRFFITSPTWPCLAKFVGDPVPVDLDANGTIDGMAATLVDNFVNAGELTPTQWTGLACDNLSPTCSVDADCGAGGSCLPIMRCSESLEPCAIDADCPVVGETCIPGKLYVTGPDITPSDRNAAPVQYRVQADCGGVQTQPQTVQMQLFGDTDGSGVINAGDITLVVLGFQLFYHLPLGDPNGTLTVTVDHRGSANVCSIAVPPLVNVADITATVRSFQLLTYLDEVANSECSLPCP